MDSLINFRTLCGSRAQQATPRQSVGKQAEAATTTVPKPRIQWEPSQRVDEPERGAPAAGGSRARRYRSQPSHTPAVLIPREQSPLLPCEPFVFSLIYGQTRHINLVGRTHNLLSSPPESRSEQTQKISSLQRVLRLYHLTRRLSRSENNPSSTFVASTCAGLFYCVF